METTETAGAAFERETIITLSDTSSKHSRHSTQGRQTRVTTSTGAEEGNKPMRDPFVPLSVRRSVYDAIAHTEPDGFTDPDWLKTEAAVDALLPWVRSLLADATERAERARRNFAK